MTQRLTQGVVFLAAALAASSAWAVDKTWNGSASTNYQTANNWTPSGVPTTNDRAIIPNPLPAGSKGFPIVAAGQTVVLDQLVVQPGATLSILDGATVSMDGKKFPLIDGNTAGTLGTGAGTISTPGTGILEINVQGNGVAINQTMTIPNTFVKCNGGGTQCQIQNGVTVTIVGSLQINIGTIQLGVGAQPPTMVQVRNGPVNRGSVTITPNGTVAMQANNSTLALEGDWVVSGKKFNQGNGSTVLFNGTGDQAISITVTHLGDGDFENLAIAGDATKTPGYRTVTVNNNPSIVNGFEVNGDLTVGANANLLVLDGCNQAGDQGIGHAQTDVFRIDNGATVTFRSNCNLSGAISFTDASNNPSTGTIRIENTLTADGTVMGTVFNAGNGTVEFAGQTLSQTVWCQTKGIPLAYWNLTIDTIAGFTATQEAARPLNVQNTLTIGKTTAGVTNTAAIFVAAPAQKITVGKDFIDNATFTAGTSMVTMTATSGTGRIASDLAAPALLAFNQLFVNHHVVAAATTPAAPTLALTAASAGAGSVNNGTHSYVVTYVTAGGESPPGPSSNVVTLVGNSRVQLTNIPVGPAGTTGRRLYRTKAGNNGDPQFLVLINDNTTTSFLDNTADGGLANTLPAFYASLGGGGNVTAGTHSYVVTFVDANGFESSAGVSSNVVTVPAATTHVQLANIPLGPAGTVSRNLYRTIAGNTGTPFFLDSITNNTGTTYDDNLPDSSLADPPPIVSATGVVTAARNFTVNSTFQVVEGTLTTSGVLGAPITMTATIGTLVGDGAGAAGTSQLLMVGPDILAVAANQTLSVNQVDGLLTSRANGGLRIEANNPTLRSVSGRFLTTVNGQLDLWGLNFRDGDPNGINIMPTATVLRIRNVWFRNPNATAGACFVTFNVTNIDLDCPGCFFETLPGATFNVRAKGAGSGNRIRFEDRGVTEVSAGGQGIGGPGAGDLLDDDDDPNDNGLLTDAGEVATGSIVQWVYTANVDMNGAIQGFPEPAFDWNTFAYYSSYVMMRNSSGSTDSLYVLNTNGDLRTYSITLPTVDMIGPAWWTTEGATHVVYFGTSTGQIYKMVDTGAALVPAGGLWSTPFTHGSLLAVTSPVVTDGTNVYFAGQSGPGTYGVYKVDIASKAMPANSPLSISNVQVTSGFAWWNTPSGRYLYGASVASGGASYIGRAVTSTWTLDAVFNSASMAVPPDDCTTDFASFVNVTNWFGDGAPYLYVGEGNGYMHAVNAGFTPALFGTQKTGFPFWDKNSAIQGGAVVDFFTSRVFFGNAAGDLYTLGTFTGSWIQNTNYFRFATPGGASIRTMPVFENGVLYASSSAGKVFVLDVNNGAGQTLLRTYNLGPNALGDVSRDFTTSRIYVATAGGRLYSIATFADPTPGAP
jgi:hypothetical protein